MPPNKRNVGMVFQSYALFPNMTVADNIGFGLQGPASARRTRSGSASPSCSSSSTCRTRASRYPYQLSGGQQQRVALARALAIEPQVLLLDEPLSALDAKIRVALRHEIRAIQRQLGITTVYVTHDQEEALSLSDRVVVMSEGRMEQVGTPFEIYNFPATRVRGLVRRHAQRPRRRRRRRRPRRAHDRRPGGPRRAAVRGQRRPRGHASRSGRRWSRSATARRAQPAHRQGRGRELPRLDRPDPRSGWPDASGGDRDGRGPRRVQRAGAQAAASRRDGRRSASRTEARSCSTRRRRSSRSRR